MSDHQSDPMDRLVASIGASRDQKPTQESEKRSFRAGFIRTDDKQLPEYKDPDQPHALERLTQKVAARNGRAAATPFELAQAIQDPDKVPSQESGYELPHADIESDVAGFLRTAGVQLGLTRRQLAGLAQLGRQFQLKRSGQKPILR